MEKFGFAGHTYDVDRVPTPSWDYYDILEDGRAIGGVRVLAAAVAVGQLARRYVVIGGRRIEAIVEAAIEAGIIIVTRFS